MSAKGVIRLGSFPPLWAEWNGRYRDVVRRYWKGDDGQLTAELGYRLTGSSDLYQRDGRHPSASINFITAHDGFTLHDLVTYKFQATTRRITKRTRTAPTTIIPPTTDPKERPWRRGRECQRSRTPLCSQSAHHPFGFARRAHDLRR